MQGYVKDFDWINCEAMKYWSFAKGYKHDLKTEIKNYIFSGDYYGALKVDGYYQRLIKDDEGNIFMIARNKNVKGEAVNKIDWAPQLKNFMELLPNGTVLLSECYIPNKEGSKNTTTLLGCLKETCIKRQLASKDYKDHLNFYIFDVCAFNGINYINTPFIERIQLLNKIEKEYNGDKYIHWAHYYAGQELWERLQIFLQKGREGMVITRKDCPIYFKRTPARMTIKIKKEISNTIDCVFTGRYTAPTKEYTGKELETWKYWINSVTNEKLEEKERYNEYIKGHPISPVTKSYYYGYAGSLEIGLLKDNKIIPFGYLSGLTEEIKSKPLDYKGRCIEVSAMEITDDYKLRHPKFIGFRDDLTITDCTWEQIQSA